MTELAFRFVGLVILPSSHEDPLNCRDIVEHKVLAELIIMKVEEN